MPIELPALEELHQRLIDHFKGSFPDFDVGTLSDAWKRLRVIAGLGFQLNANTQNARDALLATVAAGADLDRLANVFLGEDSRKGATPARKSDALRVTGTLAATVSIGDELTNAAGLRFQVNENAAIPVGLFVDVDIVGVDTGSQTALEAGTVLTFTSPPAGIDQTAELQLDLDEDGTDQESDGELRVRLLNAIRTPGAGGNANDYRTFITEDDPDIDGDGIFRGYVYPLRGGRGSVDVAALHAGSGTVRLLTAPERTALADAINDSKRPVSVKAFRVLEVTTLEQDIELTITIAPGSQFAFDWNDIVAPIVASWEPGGATRTIRFTLDRPTDMQEGDRIVIKTAAGDGTGEQFTIESLPGTLTDIVIDRVPSPVPVATDLVYSGGNLTDTVRDAILSFMNNLGPSVGSFGVGDWESDIPPERILAIALQTTGVRDGTVITPATTIVPDDPAFPLDDTIELLIPGEVVVRKEH